MKRWKLEWRNDVVWFRSITVWSVELSEEELVVPIVVVVVVVVKGEESLGFRR